MEDWSDKETERFTQENTVAKWFCGFGLKEKTPDHAVSYRTRKLIGTESFSDIFSCLRDQPGKRCFLIYFK